MIVWLAVLFIVGLLLPCYLAWRVADAFGGRIWVRCTAFALTLCLFYASHLLPLNFVMDRSILVLLIAVANASVLMPVLLLFTEPVRYVCRSRRMKYPRRTILAVVAAVSASLGVVGEINALKFPQVKEVEVAITDLPPEFDGYRVAFLTDLHFCRTTPDGFAQYIVETTNARQPDIVLFGGDYADDMQDSQISDLQSLKEISAPDGKFAVAGNHEYFNNYAAIVSALSMADVRMLVNRNVIIGRGEHAAIAVAGVTDRSISRKYGRKISVPSPNLQAAIKDVPETVPVILLSHQPKDARKNAASGRVALQLSGHTHGGMIVGVAQLIVAPLNGGFVSGLYRVGGMLLYVSNGTGLWNGFSWRLGTPAEITMITLRPC